MLAAQLNGFYVSCKNTEGMNFSRVFTQNGLNILVYY